MDITQDQVSLAFEEISDAGFCLQKFGEKSHVPQDLAKRIRAMATELCNLAGDMEEHFDEHGDRQVIEEDDNAGFNELMDMDIRGMLATMRIR